MFHIKKKKNLKKNYIDTMNENFSSKHRNMIYA